MLQILLISFSLVLVIEGLLPFLLPDFWRKNLSLILLQDNRTLRILGLTSMLLGLGLLFLIKHLF